MALGILSIIFIILVVAAVMLQVLLYKVTKNPKTNDWIFILNILLGVIVSFMAFSALPSNFIGQRAVALGWGLLAIIAFPLKSKFPKVVSFSKIVLTISLVGGLSQLFS